MNNELSQVGDWWILIRNLTYHRPPAFVLAALKGCSVPAARPCVPHLLVPVMPLREPVVGPGEMQPPRLGTTLLLVSCRWRDRECASKKDGKRWLSGHPTSLLRLSAGLVNCIQLIYCEQILTLLLSAFIFFPNDSFNTPVWDVLVKCLKLQRREKEHQSASALSCRELSSVILSGLAGEGQYDPKDSPRTRRQVRFSQTVLWEGHVLGPQFLQL